MDDYVEEDEIKIEYYESFETDPLCEKSDENDVEKYFQQDFVSTNNKDDEVSISNNDECDDSNDHHDLSPILPAEQDDKELNISTESTKEIHWYKDVDESGKFVCKFCDLTYSTIQTIRHHVKTKHPECASVLKELIKHNKRNPKIKCHICKKRFKDNYSLKVHLKEHYSENLTRSCQVCFATFKDDREMTEHLYHKHENMRNIKIYSCSICGYRTQKLSHLKQHKNTHVKSKQMKCDFCDYSTNYSPNLKIHQRIHTKEKPYVCTYNNCGYSCGAKSALRSHQLKHYPDENMLYCDKCTYKTVYKNSLKKHIDSHKRNSLKLF